MKQYIKSLLMVASLILPALTYGDIINIPEDYESIQEGIDEASEGDTVLVAPGEYNETIDFDGKDITVASLILTAEDEAYIDSTIIIAEEDRSCVVFNSEESEAAVLMGFTVTGADTDYGGGIYISGASPTLSSLVISDNEVDRGGGAIYCTDQAEPTLNDIVIKNNHSALIGGGIALYSGSSIVADKLTITGNESRFEGGAISCDNSSILIDDFYINGNNGRGGGHGTYGGGCIRGLFDSNIILRNGEISANSGGEDSPIKLFESELYIESVAIIDNTYESQHLINCVRSPATLIDATLVADPLNEYVFRSTDEDLTAVNCIFLGGSEEVIIEATGSITYSIVKNGEDGVNENIEYDDSNLEDDPLFTNPDSGDYSLTYLSPCIDAGDPNSPLDTDSSRADIGAIPFLHGGPMSGYVYDLETEDPITVARLGSTNDLSTVTDVNGFWKFEFPPLGLFSLTASAPGYNDSTINDLLVEIGDTLEIDFNLRHPELELSEEEVSIDIENDEEAEINFTLHNTGNGILEWTAEERPPEDSDYDQWDLRRSIGVGEITERNYLYGVVYVDGNFYVSGRHTDAAENHKIHIISSDEEYIGSFDQPQAENRNGFIDLTFDGELIWGGIDHTVYGITTDGDSITSFEVDLGGRSDISAIAWDSDREVFWVAGIVTSVFPYDRDGNRSEEYEILDRNGLRNYGLSYWAEAPDEYKLYVCNKPTGEPVEIVKVNPENGDTSFVSRLIHPDGLGLSAGGIQIVSGYDLYSDIFLHLATNGNRDRIDIWQLNANTRWMMLDPNAGSVFPEDEQELTLLLDARELPVNNYIGNIRFVHNASEGETYLPVFLEVRMNAHDSDLILPPSSFSLSSFPNPFNSTLNIEYTLPLAGDVSVKLFDISGRLVVAIDEGLKQVGMHNVMFEAENLASGVYMIKLETENNITTRKALLVR